MSLSFKDIHFSYGDAPVLQNVSFTATAGEITGLIGESGSGKTTLLRLAAGLLPLQDGHIHVDDTPLSGPPEHRPVGLVFQDAALFPHMNAAKNIAFGLPGKTEAHQQEITRLLTLVGLPGFEDRHPHTLSGGQQQRIAIARALAPQPKVLLLDEPFASLDAVLRRRMRAETRDMLRASNSAVMLVTHDPEEAMEMCDRIVVLENGRIAQDGRPAELYHHPKSALVARLIAGAQSVSVTKTEAGLDTPFGIWPLSALKDVQANGHVLMVKPYDFTLTPAAGDIHITDIRAAGREDKITLTGPTGEAVTATVPVGHSFSVGDSVNLKPKAGKAMLFG